MHRLPRALTLRQQSSAFRQLRYISQSQRRFLPQTLYRPTGEALRYQSVRFKKPGFTFRRIATIGLYAGAAYAYFSIVWRYLDIEIEILEDEEEDVDRQKQEDGEDAAEDEDEEDEGPFYAEEDSTFIPLTWATKLPRSFYKGSDPEWQEFVKFAKDKPRHKVVQNELVQIVYAGTSQHPLVSRQLGKNTKVGKYWLDISFPDGPPQEYQRSGIEIGDGFIAWSQEKVSQEKQWRLMRALWPKAAFDSVYATTSVLMGIHYRRVKQALGLEDKDPFSPEERYRHAIEMMEKQQQARERKSLGKAQTDPDGHAGALTGSTSTSSADAKSTAADGKKLPWQLSVPMPSASSSSSIDLPIAIHTFSAALSKSWNPKNSEPPRGSFVVQGLVEVRGDRGRMLFDVQSCYDPRMSKYVVVRAAVRNFKRWNQSPKGGP